MTLHLVRQTLRGRRRTILWFAVGMGAYSLLIAGLWPSFREFDFTSIYDSIPEALRTTLGGAAIDELGTADTAFYQYLTAEFATWAPMVMAFFGIWVGAGVIARDYDGHTLDVLMSQPLTRRQFLLARFAAVVLATIPVVAVAAIGLLVGAAVWVTDVSINLWSIALMFLQLGLFGVATAGIGLLLATLFLEPGRSYGYGAALIAIMFVLAIVGDIVAEANWVGYLSLFGYWNPLEQVARDAFVWRDAAVLVGVAAVTTTLATTIFRRRDMAT